MGCGQSFDNYNAMVDLPITPRQPPDVPVCAELVVPAHEQKWGFILKPAMFSATGNDFNVVNQLGQPIAIVRGKYFSLHDKQMILNPAGAPLLLMQKKLLGVHNTYYLSDPVNGMVIGTIRKRLTLFAPVYELYRGEQYDDPDNLIWKMQGDFFSMRYAILDKYGPVARAEANPFTQFTNFGLTGFNYNESYFVEIASGVESLLVLTMCVVADEVRAEELRQREENQRRNTYNNNNYYGGSRDPFGNPYGMYGAGQGFGVNYQTTNFQGNTTTTTNVTFGVTNY